MRQLAELGRLFKERKSGVVQFPPNTETLYMSISDTTLEIKAKLRNEETERSISIRFHDKVFVNIISTVRKEFIFTSYRYGATNWHGITVYYPRTIEVEYDVQLDRFTVFVKR